MSVKYYMICDVGTKNFCYLIVSVDDATKILTFVAFEIVVFNTKALVADVVATMERVCDTYPLTRVYIELQVWKNNMCSKIETIQSTFLYLRQIQYKKVTAQSKLKLFNITTSTYSVRKAEAVRIGKELLLAHTCTNEVIVRLESLKKKDDFYDCVLMAVTELIPTSVA